MQTFDPLGRLRHAWWKFLHRRTTTWRSTPDSWNPFGQLAELASLSDVRRFVDVEDYWGAAGTLKRHVSDRLPHRTFEGLCDPAAASCLIRRFPEECRRILDEAGRLLDGRFDLSDRRGLWFGDPPDWHLDPLSRCRAPLVHWSLLNSAQPVVGHRPIIWELNRHQWLITLGQAYRLTGERRFAERFEYLIRDWIRMNPFGMGINWSSSAEVAKRLIAWCWALGLFHGSSVLTADFFTLFVDHLRLHAVHLERYRSLHGARPVDAMTEGLGLLYLGLHLPEFRLSGRWVDRGWEMVRRPFVHLRYGLLLPGWSTDEQRLAAECLLHALLLIERHHLADDGPVRERLHILLDRLLELMRPDGLMVRLGPRMPEWLVPITARRPLDWQGLYGLAAVLYGDPHHAWAAGSAPAELLWLTGLAGLDRFDTIPKRPPAVGTTPASGAVGFVSMRSGWNRHSHHLIFDVGPSTDSWGLRRHRVAEPLGIQCSAYGEALVIDPDPPDGRDEQPWRGFFQRDTQSTLIVDGVTHRLFGRLKREPRRHRSAFRQWTSGDRYELAEADQERDRWVAQPIRHRRRVLFVNRAYWVLIDDLEGRGRHRLELRFHLASDKVELDRSTSALVWSLQGPGLAIQPFATVPLNRELRAVEERSGAPSGRHDAGSLTLAYVTEAEFPLRLVTHLFPLESKDTPIPQATPFLDEAGRLTGSSIDHPPATIMFSDRTITVEAA